MTKQQMKWDPEQQAYVGVTSDGDGIRVEGDEMAESAQDVDIDVSELSVHSHTHTWKELSKVEQELLDPDQWETCIGANQNVEYVG